MPIHGGYTPGFERYGGRAPALKRIVESLAQQRGTVYDNDQTGNVFIENMAIARAIAEAWSNNQRMSNQWDSARMTEFIPRWETILGIVPKHDDTEQDRRERIARAFEKLTQTNIYQTVYDLLISLIPDIFIRITHTSHADAVNWVDSTLPEVWNGAAWVARVAEPSGLVTWYSSSAHILIEVSQPSGMLDGEFYETVAQINSVLDSILPGWVTWDWCRDQTIALHTVSIISSTNTTPIVVTAGTPGDQHGFVVGQTVTVADHLVNTNANGSWVISAVGGTTSGGTGTTLTLTGSVGNGVGGATGTVYAPGFYLDGDAVSSGTLVNLDNEVMVDL
jgi:hypothetical protein